MMNLICLMDHTLYLIDKIILSILLKNTTLYHIITHANLYQQNQKSVVAKVVAQGKNGKNMPKLEIADLK